MILLLAGGIGLFSQGCTYRAWYEGWREQQRQDCYRHANQSDLQECLEKVNGMTYEQYEKEREAMKNRPK